MYCPYSLSPNVLTACKSYQEGFPGGSLVKNLPAQQETWVQSLGREDPLEEGMAAHSVTLACEIPRTEEPGGLELMGPQRVGHNLATEKQLQQVVSRALRNEEVSHMSHLCVSFFTLTLI